MRVSFIKLKGQPNKIWGLIKYFGVVLKYRIKYNGRDAETNKPGPYSMSKPLLTPPLVTSH